MREREGNREREASGKGQVSTTRMATLKAISGPKVLKQWNITMEYNFQVLKHFTNT